MRQFFWRSDRLGWPLVVAVVFLTLFLLATDFSWRTLTIPFEQLMIGVVLAGVISTLFLVAMFVFLRRRGNSG